MEAEAMTQLRLPEAVAEGRIHQSWIDRMVRLLSGHGWQSTRVLLIDMQCDDRTIRAIASASEGRIISGQKGYCLIEEATVEEANHAAAWLEHQAKAMAKRASEIRRAMHKRSAA